MFFRELSFGRKSKDYRILDFLQKIYKKPCTLSEPYNAHAICGFLNSSMILPKYRIPDRSIPSPQHRSIRADLTIKKWPSVK
jgi:hypothetical protein